MTQNFRQDAMPRIQDQIASEDERRAQRQRTQIACKIIGVNPRNRSLHVMNMGTGDNIPHAAVMPFSAVHRIPTAQSNWVIMLTPDENQSVGIPILFDRNYREPLIFDTLDPMGEEA